MKLGIEQLLSDKKLLRQLAGLRVALVAHPASVDHQLRHSIDLLMACPEVNLVSAFGPQHGMRGEKQDNMIESDDYRDPIHNISVFSLYGNVRKPTDEMLSTFDVVLLDMQDVGCRIYTYLTTLFYMVDACEAHNKQVWVLDRPNAAGRPVEGLNLDMQFESFVGAAPVPMRHGLTLGEMALWYKAHRGYKLDVQVVPMQGYDPIQSPGYGWPGEELSWVNPSPNMPRLSCARMYAGTVLLEGTNLSEGRGSTIPLEVFGHPDIDSVAVIAEMKKVAPHWLKGCLLRACYFEPTFHKFSGQLCSAIQIHVDHPEYDHDNFKPFRVVSLFLKALKNLYPQLEIWRPPPYEYEQEKMPIDILSGDSRLRKWVDDPSSTVQEWEEWLAADESTWHQERKSFLIYG